MIEGDALSQRREPVPPGYARGAPLPWWLKLGTKLFLAGIGLHGARARALGIAEPSFTTLEPGRLLDAPELWMRRARAVLGRTPRSLLELGPGRMVLRAPVLAGLGFGRIWYTDPVDSAPTGPAPYAEAAAMARARGVPVPDLSGANDRGAVLARCGATLLIGGPEALRAIPDGSVDLVVSEVVLEHVRREDIAPLLAQLRRVTAPDGLGLHWVDFHDHLGGGLQHLPLQQRLLGQPARRAGRHLRQPARPLGPPVALPARGLRGGRAARHGLGRAAVRAAPPASRRGAPRGGRPGVPRDAGGPAGLLRRGRTRQRAPRKAGRRAAEHSIGDPPPLAEARMACSLRAQRRVKARSRAEVTPRWFPQAIRTPADPCDCGVSNSVTPSRRTVPNLEGSEMLMSSPFIVRVCTTRSTSLKVFEPEPVLAPGEVGDAVIANVLGEKMKLSSPRLPVRTSSPGPPKT